MNQDATVAIIPARYGSTRLPGKPLLSIADKPMVVRVCERAAAASSVSRVVVATDDRRVKEAVEAEGFECRMTRADHETGTDRLAEVAASLEAALVVNVQGDEPLLPPSTIDAAVAALAADERAVAATTCEPISEPSELANPNVVKVVCRGDGRALYFSRAAIPFVRDPKVLGEWPAPFRKHTGLYVYRRDFLLKLAALEPSPLERSERLEQLRILENGYDLLVVEVAEPSIGVDTLEDLDRARRLWEPVAARGGAK